MAFEYTYTHQFTESEYVAINSTLSPRTRVIRYLGGAVLAVICLMWPYTFVMGLFIMGLLVVSFFAPGLVRVGSRSTFRQSKLLKTALTYRVTDSALSIVGEGVDLKCSWSNLIVWRENAGWLILSPSGMESIRLQVAKLKEDGVYESIIKLASKNGMKFNSKRKLAA
jgi:hypothetical protein